MAPSRHQMLLSMRWLLPAAALMAAALGVTAHGRWAHVAGVAIAFVLAFIALVQSRLQPVVVVDDEGYAVEQGGRVRFRVAWREVVKVRADARERALYIDCGDRTRNLLVPPARGFGFRFVDAGALYARVLAAVASERVEQVERLDDGRDRPPA